MSTKEQALFTELKDLLTAGFITQYEYDWCQGAVKNRHGLTKETRHQLRDTVIAIISQARSRFESET